MGTGDDQCDVDGIYSGSFWIKFRYGHNCTSFLCYRHQCTSFLRYGHQCTSFLRYGIQCTSFLRYAHQCTSCLRYGHQCTSFLRYGHHIVPTLWPPVHIIPTLWPPHRSYVMTSSVHRSWARRRVSLSIQQRNTNPQYLNEQLALSVREKRTPKEAWLRNSLHCQVTQLQTSRGFLCPSQRNQRTRLCKVR